MRRTAMHELADRFWGIGMPAGSLVGFAGEDLNLVTSNTSPGAEPLAESRQVRRARERREAKGACR